MPPLGRPLGRRGNLRKPSLAAAIRSEVRRHTQQDLKKAQKRLRKMQKQLTEMRRLAQAHARILLGMRRRIRGLHHISADEWLYAARRFAQAFDPLLRRGSRSA